MCTLWSFLAFFVQKIWLSFFNLQAQISLIFQNMALKDSYVVINLAIREYQWKLKTYRWCIENCNFWPKIVENCHSAAVASQKLSHISQGFCMCHIQLSLIDPFLTQFNFHRPRKILCLLVHKFPSKISINYAYLIIEDRTIAKKVIPAATVVATSVLTRPFEQLVKLRFSRGHGKKKKSATPDDSKQKFQLIRGFKLDSK